METNYRLLLFIAGFILFSSCSCGQTVSHDKAIEYYIIVATEMKNSSKIVNDLVQVTAMAYIAAEQDQKKMLESGYIDTLINYYDVSTIALGKSIDKLSTVCEIDQSINLKARSLTLLIDIKTLIDSSWPPMIKILSRGLGQPTDKERELLEKLMLIVDELKTANADVEKLARDFRDKHNITNDDIKKYGL